MGAVSRQRVVSWYRALSASDLKRFSIFLAVFIAAYAAPLHQPRVAGAVMESLFMLREYAREHVLLCLVPALFIAGAIANFVTQPAVIRYLGAGAKRWVSYTVASVSGTILAVCSCTVLPLFAGIYRRGAGIGPATAFLYSGPAINILAIILTSRVLGWQLGLARAVGAIAFSVLIGMAMAALFKKEDAARIAAVHDEALVDEEGRSLYQNATFFVILVLILVFAAWGQPAQPVGFWNAVYAVKWHVTLALLLLLTYALGRWFGREERMSWLSSTWGFAQQILPLLFGGVLMAGLLMGRPGSDAGLIPSYYVSAVVGGNSLLANLAASVIAAFMYFATLTEIPILQGLIGAGMGQGPALALLLAGPSLSLPSMLVIGSVLGPRKTLAFVALVVSMATVAGMLFGMLVA